MVGSVRCVWCARVRVCVVAFNMGVKETNCDHQIIRIEFNLLFEFLIFSSSSFDLQLNFGMIYSTGMIICFFRIEFIFKTLRFVKMILINVF